MRKGIMKPQLHHITNSQIEQAAWLLYQALEAPERGFVVVIHDKHTESAAKAIEIAGSQKNTEIKLCFVSAKQQKRHSTDPSLVLDRNLRRKINSASRIVVLQERTPENNRFRLKVLNYAKSLQGKRVASMPGVSLDYLKFCRGDLADLTARCRLYAERLLWGRMAIVKTVHPDSGKTLELEIPIGNHFPKASTGRVPLDGWCNVPSGETFIVPNLGETMGEIAITGSMLGYPFGAEEGLVFTIDRGRVVYPVECFGFDIENRISKILFDGVGKEVFENCSIVAELGIGLNDNINEFTGLPIFDEKIAGTVHIGLGSSDQFDGGTTCMIHNDFVTKCPTLFVDETCLISNGNLCLSQNSAFPNFACSCCGSSTCCSPRSPSVDLPI